MAKKTKNDEGKILELEKVRELEETERKKNILLKPYEKYYTEFEFDPKEDSRNFPIKIREAIFAWIDTGDDKTLLSELYDCEFRFETDEPYFLEENQELNINRYNSPLVISLKAIKLNFAFGQEKEKKPFSMPLNKELIFRDDPYYEEQKEYMEYYSKNTYRLGKRYKLEDILQDIKNQTKHRIEPKKTLTDILGKEEKDIPDELRGPVGVIEYFKQITKHTETDPKKLLSDLKKALPYLEIEIGTLDGIIQYAGMIKRDLDKQDASMSKAEKDIVRKLAEDVTNLVEERLIKRGLKFSQLETSGGLSGIGRQDPPEFGGKKWAYYDIIHKIKNLSNFASELVEEREIIAKNPRGGTDALKGEFHYINRGIDDILKYEQLKRFRVLANKINKSNREMYEEGREIQEKIDDIEKKKNSIFSWFYKMGGKFKEEGEWNRRKSERDGRLVSLSAVEEKIKEYPKGNFQMEREVFKEFKTFVENGEKLIIYEFFEKNKPFKKGFANYRKALKENLRKYHAPRYETIAAYSLSKKGLRGLREEQYPEELSFSIPKGQDGVDITLEDGSLLIGRTYTGADLKKAGSELTIYMPYREKVEEEELEPVVVKPKRKKLSKVIVAASIIGVVSGIIGINYLYNLKPSETVVQEETSMQTLRKVLNEIDYVTQLPDTGEVYNLLMSQAVKEFKNGFNLRNYGQDFKFSESEKNSGECDKKTIDAIGNIYDWYITNDYSTEEEKKAVIVNIKKMVEK